MWSQPQMGGRNFLGENSCWQCRQQSPSPAGRQHGCESKQRGLKPSEVSTPPGTHLSNRLRLRIGEEQQRRFSESRTTTQRIGAARPAPPEARTRPRHLSLLQLLDTTSHPENQVIYRKTCCQQLVEKTPFGSGMLRHIFKWVSCGKAYCIL